MKNWIGNWIWNRLSIRMTVEWEGAKERNIENITFLKNKTQSTYERDFIMWFLM